MIGGADAASIERARPLLRATGDRLAEEKYTRRLRIEFAGSEQLRSLEPKRNPG